jgi:hypothetical protein
MRRVSIIITIIILSLSNLFGQNSIKFKEPLKVIVNDKLGGDIKKGSEIYLTEITYILENNFPTLTIKGKAVDGNSLDFEYKKLKNVTFNEIDNIDKLWDKQLLINNTYENILSNGYQYSLRNELDNDANEYIRALYQNGKIFEDKYFEDYLYTIINKLYSGKLNDDRPGNVYIKILKDPEPNAFALPNGCIIISTGLLSTIQSEDELVGILAHEISHYELDHQVLNYNKEIDRKKRAEFWSTFATVIAAGADAYLAAKNEDHIPGIITASTMVASSIFSSEIVTRLGIKYNQSQESSADKTAQEILSLLKYDKMGLAAALSRIKNYCILTGNYLALSGNGTHPSLESRITELGGVPKMGDFSQPSFLRKVSLINSENAWIEFWYNSHQSAALDLVDRNIKNGVGTESDYLIKAIIKRRTNNKPESNTEVLALLSSAKALNVTPLTIIYKEEGITHLRLGNRSEAKKSFEIYINSLSEILQKMDKCDSKEYRLKVQEEINWTKKMIFKIDKL